MIENDETNSSADDFDFEKINIQEFLNSESESSDADIDEETVTNTHIVSEKLYEVSQLQIKNRFSYKCAADVIDLVNNMPGTKIQIPKYKAALQNAAADACQEKPMFFCFVNPAMNLWKKRKSANVVYSRRKIQKKIIFWFIFD